MLLVSSLGQAQLLIYNIPAGTLEIFEAKNKETNPQGNETSFKGQPLLIVYSRHCQIMQRT
jgi:hypothetical protein